MAEWEYMAAARKTPGKRIQVTREQFDYMLGVLPPVYARGCMGVGEAYSSTASGDETRIWFTERWGHCYCMYGTRSEAERVFAYTRGDATAALKRLHGFIGPSQLAALNQAFRGEEREFFFEKLSNMARIVETMPGPYGQDGRGDNATVWLHYFTAGCDWFITEKDSDPDGVGQYQAFGLANLGYGGELGYIPIASILEEDVELDLYFKPCLLREVKRKRERVA